MARKNNTDILNAYAGTTAPDPEDITAKKTNYNPKSLKNLQRNHRPKAPTSYMQINVHGYDDYLYRMARYNKKTITKYVLSLIEKDAAEHVAEYENLKQLSEFDKPYRESPNRKKKVEE